MKKILVIEDTYEVRDNLDEILSLSGYEVYTADNGREGVKLAISVLPDLILCDIMMPKMDGFGVVRILSSKPETSHIPFIFLTAKGEKQDFRKGMNLGADDYITKPFNDVELLDAIAMRLQKNEQLQVASQPTPEAGAAFIQQDKGAAELVALTQNQERRSFIKKAELFTEGQHPRYLYYIHRGKVKLFHTNKWGKEFIIDIYGEGDFLGYEALMQDKPYIESAVALQAVEVSLIPKDEFLQQLYDSRAVSLHFIKMLAQKTRQCEEKLTQLAYDTIRKRMANTLLLLAEKFDGEGISIMRDDLGALVGTAKETAIRTLSEFKDEGLIKITNGKIFILAAEKLADLPA